jgi:hypothetical protein
MPEFAQTHQLKSSSENDSPLATLRIKHDIARLIMCNDDWLLNTLFSQAEFDYRPAEQLVAEDKTETGSRQLVYPPIIIC